MVQTRKLMENIKAYVPGESIERAKQLYGDIEIIKMASNENPIGASPKAIAAMMEECKQVNFYPDTKATKLTEAIARHYQLETNEVIVTAGSNGSLYSLAGAYLNPGEEVLFCAPTYPTYTLLAQLYEAIPVGVPMDESFTYNLGKLKAAITEKTKLIFLCNPNNPTGTMLPSREIEQFIREIRDDILVIVDEAYIEFADCEEKDYSIRFIKEFDNVVVLRTFSKIYGLAGARIGYAMSNPTIIDVIYRMQPFAAFARPSLAAAYESLLDEEFLQKSFENNRTERAFLMKAFAELGYDCIPSQTNFIYMDVHQDGKKLFEDLKPLGLVIRPQHDTIVRITVGTHYQNEKLIAALYQLKGGKE